MTNADRIRAMTDEELSVFLAGMTYSKNCSQKCRKEMMAFGEIRTYCDDCWLEWMKKDVDE